MILDDEFCVDARPSHPTCWSHGDSRSGKSSDIQITWVDLALAVVVVFGRMDI